MPKTVPSTTNIDCMYFKSKCAEIHYQTSTFFILCISCGISTSSFTHFVDHFRKKHFEDFPYAMLTTAEPVVTTVYEENINTSNGYHDPLEFSSKTNYENSTEAMKRLQFDELEMMHMKTESQDGLINTAKNGKMAANRHQFNDSEDEYLICKVKIEESDFKVAHRFKPRKVRNCHTALEYDVKEQRTAAASVESCEADNFSENSKSARDEENEVDWAESFKPNMVKNHEKRPYKPRNKLNVCTYCGRSFRRRYQMDTHLNIHTGLKPHQCEICGKCFRAVTTLMRHLNTHEQRQAHNCRFCAKTFTHKAALLSHEVRHTQKRSVPCNECDKWFYTDNQMDTHKRKIHHKADETLQYGCDFCVKRYRSASMLSTHKFKKHYRTAKYSCEQCDKKFITERQLEMHRLIHVNGSPNLNLEAQ